MSNKPKCEIGCAGGKHCDNLAQITLTVDGVAMNCCRNHASEVVRRAKRLGVSKIKVEPIPPEP